MSGSASSNNFNHGFPTPGTQSPTGQHVMDHVFFLSHDSWKHAREDNQYDLVIIGTGFCGLAVAHRALANNPYCRILLIERGSFFLPEHFQNLPIPYMNTLGGLSETFPWTLSDRTNSVHEGTIIWQHGMVPFFGGRSTLWSAWCPRPTIEEMSGWPNTIIEAARQNFDSAEKLLHVQKADSVDVHRSESELGLINRKRPVYGALQRVVQGLLAEGTVDIPAIYRSEAAPLASRAEDMDGIDFLKYSTPAELLELVLRQSQLAEEGKGEPLHIVADCIVERIIQQEGRATALQTSRGIFPLGNAKLVLGMGTLPPTTLARNSFPIPDLGERFSAHFITAVTARVRRDQLDPHGKFGSLEIGACYIGGRGKDWTQQFHIQLSAISDKDPGKNAKTALRYMPDVVATASQEQLESSTDHVVFVCAVLGELDFKNNQNWFRLNPHDTDLTTNSLLQIVESASDCETWDVMDESTFSVLEGVLSPGGVEDIEYWHGAPDKGMWKKERPEKGARRIDALVHESSTLHIGECDTDPVDLDYKLRHTENVYITGGALWPQGGSWNPTLTMVALAMDLADKLTSSTKVKKSPS